MTRDKHGRLTRTTFSYGEARVSLIYEDEQYARLVGLHSENPGHGEAKMVLMEATQHADNHGLTLGLEAKRFGNRPDSLDNSQLVSFYERFGFDLIQPIVDHKLLMVRYPLSNGE